MRHTVQPLIVQPRLVQCPVPYLAQSFSVVWFSGPLIDEHECFRQRRLHYAFYGGHKLRMKRDDILSSLLRRLSHLVQRKRPPYPDCLPLKVEIFDLERPAFARPAAMKKEKEEDRSIRFRYYVKNLSASQHRSISSLNTPGHR